MAIIRDRRGERDNKGHSSRERFMQRNKKRIKEAIDKAISDSDIEEIGNGGVDVTVPKDDLKQPNIHHGSGGINKKVLPGNKDFSTGDRMPKPQGGGGGGTGNGEPGEGEDGEDDFIFALTEEEFLNYLFQDMELPNLEKKTADDAEMTVPKRAGYTTDGPHNKLDLVRSKTSQLARQFAVKKPQDKKILDLLKEQRLILLNYDPDFEAGQEEELYEQITAMNLSMKIKAVRNSIGELVNKYQSVITDEDKEKLGELHGEVAKCEKIKKQVPAWNESTDLRYRNHDEKPAPTTKAAMFCLMDVSGSMTQDKKNNAKLFYMLLYRFLKRNYQQVDVVFIRHTTEAEEVDEHTFFYDPKSGGTKVSTSIAKMSEILDERYSPSEWNIYGAQASDGENFGDDNAMCDDLLRKLLKRIQAYFYTEVTEPFDRQFSQWATLWGAYEEIANDHPEQFFMGKINEKKDIWPVFRKFFQKNDGGGYAPAASQKDNIASLRPSLP
ncbi:MAG: YeaH/YhbH family protein [Alphaproteobacteria bacterium]|jgi:hypothetical protein|nr:YeaH/YhbH family protein [Alphaproteobacteria bacterium]MDP7223416.1 YeaH/YhbH family protein [Alphaproteobacteria bacterium]